MTKTPFTTKESGVLFIPFKFFISHDRIESGELLKSNLRVKRSEIHRKEKIRERRIHSLYMEAYSCDAHQKKGNLKEETEISN
jgi:hypothetical protein